jgi:serine/threonine protein kinase
LAAAAWRRWISRVMCATRAKWRSRCSELAAVLAAERFLAEITTTANLQHPHILPLFDSGSANAQVMYVMPYRLDVHSTR